MAWVIVPAAMNGVRSWGIRAVPLAAAVWLGKVILPAGLPMANGVMSIAGITFEMVIGALMSAVPPWAAIVVPCGMEGIRTTVPGSAGWVVWGTIIHSPGSTWMRTDWAGTVTSVITWR